LDASLPDRPQRRTRTSAVLLLSLLSVAPSASAQVGTEPVLNGKALLGDDGLADGTVVLHNLTDDSQGALDSVTVGRDGSFSFTLPRVPDPERNDVFFASIRHDGVMYFGGALTLAGQLDSVYVIQTYDTVPAPEEGADLPVQVRNILFEP